MKICWVRVSPRRGVDGVRASGTSEFYPNTPVSPSGEPQRARGELARLQPCGAGELPLAFGQVRREAPFVGASSRR